MRRISVIHLVAILGVSLIFVSLTSNLGLVRAQSNTGDQTPVTQSVLIGDLIADAVSNHEDVLAFNIYDVRADTIRYSANGLWAVVDLVFVDPQSGQVVPTEPGLGVARLINGAWRVALQADPDWVVWVRHIPGDLLSKEAKEYWLFQASRVSPESVNTFGGYKLPWPAGQTKTLVRSVSHGDNGPEEYAFDFDDGSMFELRASKSGTVYKVIWTYENGYNDGNCNHANYLVVKDTSTSPTTYVIYLHLKKDSIPDAKRQIGAPVSQGEFIGNADDTGCSSDHHVHIQVHTNPDSWYGTSQDMTFDDVSINGGRPRTPSEAAWYGGQGQSTYTSGNVGGSTCPAPSQNSPGDGAVLTNRTITFSWNPPSNCTFQGYTFRVCTTSDVANGSGCFIDTGEGGTSRTETISGRDNQDLWWGVRTANPLSPNWAVRRFRIQPATACSAPSLNSPADNAILTNRTVSFSWNALSGCTFSGYTFRICTSSDVSNLSNCFVDRGEGGTSSSVTINGRDNQDLWWGVRAANAPDGASWASRKFRIQPPTACSAPTLNSPADNATLTNRNVTFSWNALSGCTFNGYTFRVCTSSDVGNLSNCQGTGLIDTGVGGTSYSYEITGRDNVDLWWGVRAANAPNGASWAARKFRIEPAPPPSPDLRPFVPSGWQYPGVPNSVAGGTQATTTLYAGKDTFFDWAFINSGNGTAAGSFHVEVRLDDVWFIRYPYSNYGPGSEGGFADWSHPVVTPGWHTLKIIADPDNTIAESNEGNNVWERAFYWQPVTGWWGEYFNNETLAGNPALVRDDPAINFEWTYDSPGPGINADPFSVRWTREMNFEAGTYDFSLTHDDGISFWIDDTLVLNEWGTCCRTHQVTRSLSAGNHRLRVEMYDHYGVATAQVSWVRRAVSNDDFDSPLAITSDVYMNNQSTADATTAADDPVFACGSQDQGSASVWYRFTPSNNGVLTISTVGSNYDTIVAVWSGARGSLNSIGCNDDAGGSTTSQLSVPLVANNTYYLEIADYGFEGLAMSSKARQLEGVTAVNGGGALSLALDYVSNKPDLVVESITFSPSNPMVGQAVTISVRVRNQGNAALSQSVWLDLYLDLPPAACSTSGSGYYWVIPSGLAVGAYWDYVWSYSGLSVGQHNVWAYVDSECSAAETNEGNNIRGPVSVTVSEQSQSAAMFMSPAGAGTLAGKSFTGADILSYIKDTNTWDVLYDGSYIGTPKNVGAFAFDGDDILLGFSAAQAITGLGTAAAQDLVRFTPTSLGYNNTAGSFAWFFDGSDVGLTTAVEAVDALWIDAAGRLYISTTGTGEVPADSANPTGAKVKFQDEDVLRFTPSSTGATTAGTWSLYWDPTSVTGMSAEDINGYWEDPATGARYVTILGAFNIGNTAYGGKFAGNGKTILRFAPNAAAPGGWAPAEKLTWLAAGATFPSNIDGIEMTR